MSKLYVLSLTCLICLSACIPTDYGIDSELLNIDSCKEACWQGLTPGASTYQDVENFLNSLSTAEWPGRRIHIYESGCSWIRLTDTLNSESANEVIDLNIEADRLTFIQSDHPGTPELQEVVNHFDEPEYMKAVLGVGPDGNLYILEIYYPSKGVALIMSPKQNDVGYIKQNMQIDAIQYFEPGNLRSYFTARYSCAAGRQSASELAENEISKYIQPWPGYGKVKVIPSK